MKIAANARMVIKLIMKFYTQLLNQFIKNS